MLDATLALAQVVGLICDFISQRRDRAELSSEEFEKWLSDGKHRDIAEYLRVNAQASIATKALLSETRADLLDHLKRLNVALGQIAGGIEPLKNFAKLGLIVEPLSPGAISILRQFIALRAFKVEETNGGMDLVVVSGERNGRIEIDDVRFLTDDLATLIELRLLRVEISSSGSRLFSITRAAEHLLRGETA